MGRLHFYTLLLYQNAKGGEHMLSRFQSIKSRYTAPVWLRFFGEMLTSQTGAMMGPIMVLYLHEQLNGSV
ncbi:MFS transporter, partial [Bacillus vallismortis]|nr:MFS transporter [Bacillus vallismortis]